jgi:hypothetical protein
MPLRYTKQGWWWGSKGPFATRAKALAVARAAYSAGYKEIINPEIKKYENENRKDKTGKVDPIYQQRTDTQ